MFLQTVENEFWRNFGNQLITVTPEIIFIRVVILEVADVGIEFIRNTLEFFIFFAKHANVGIIIPRNETAVSNCAEQSAVRYDVFNVMSTADVIDFNEHISLKQLNSAKIFA